jgi:hypothetical protein
MLIIPLLTMGVPMLDTGLAIWRRSVRRAIDPQGKNRVSSADKDHLHHRLARKGLTQRRVAVLLYSIQALVFGVGLLWVFMQNYRMAIFTVAFFVGSYVGLRFLASLEMNDSGRWIVDGIRRPGRMQLFSSLMPMMDIAILSASLLVLSWLLADQCPQLAIGRLIRETAPPVVGGPMILIWATRYYRLQWTRARALEFFFFGLIATAGLLIGIAISPIPVQQSLRLTLLISLVLMSLTVPQMIFLRAIPRLAQDMLPERKALPIPPVGKIIFWWAWWMMILICGDGSSMAPRCWEPEPNWTNSSEPMMWMKSLSPPYSVLKIKHAYWKPRKK